MLQNLSKLCFVVLPILFVLTPIGQETQEQTPVTITEATQSQQPSSGKQVQAKQPLTISTQTQDQTETLSLVTATASQSEVAATETSESVPPPQTRSTSSSRRSSTRGYSGVSTGASSVNTSSGRSRTNPSLESNESIITRVYALNHSSAEIVAQIIQNLFTRTPPFTKITSDSRTNRIIIQTTAERMNEIEDLITELDVEKAEQGKSTSHFNLALQVYVVEMDFDPAQKVRFTTSFEVEKSVENIDDSHFNLEGIQVESINLSHRGFQENHRDNHTLIEIHGYADTPDALKSFIPFLNEKYGSVRVIGFNSSEIGKNKKKFYPGNLSLPDDLQPIMNKLLGGTMSTSKGKYSKYDLREAELNLESAKSNYQAAKELYDHTQQNKKRVKALFESGTLSHSEYLQAITSETQQINDIKQAEIELRRAELSLQQIQDALAKESESQTVSKNQYSVIGYWFGNVAVPGDCQAPIGPWHLEMNVENVPDGDFLFDVALNEEEEWILQNTVIGKIGQPIIIGYTREVEDTYIPGALLVIPQSDFINHANINSAPQPRASQTTPSSSRRHDDKR